MSDHRARNIEVIVAIVVVIALLAACSFFVPLAASDYLARKQPKIV